MDFYENDYSYLFSDPDMAPVWIVFAGIIAFVILMCLILFIFRSVALYRLAVNRGMSMPGLAWIPVIGKYRIGSMADDISKQNGSKGYMGIVMLIGLLVTQVGGWVANAVYLPMFFKQFSMYAGYGLEDFDSYGMTATSIMSQIASFIGFAIFVVTIVSLNKIYKCYRPTSSTAWTVLSVIFPFLPAFFLFSVRNSAPVPMWQTQPVYYPNQPVGQDWQAPAQNMGYPPNAGQQGGQWGNYPQQPPYQGQQYQQPQYPQQAQYPQPGQEQYPQQVQYPQPGQEQYPQQPQYPGPGQTPEIQERDNANDNPQNGR